MTTFRYAAIGAGGERLEGLMEAATAAESSPAAAPGAMPCALEPADRGLALDGCCRSNWAGGEACAAQDWPT